MSEFAYPSLVFRRGHSNKSSNLASIWTSKNSLVGNFIFTGTFPEKSAFSAKRTCEKEGAFVLAGTSQAPSSCGPTREV